VFTVDPSPQRNVTTIKAQHILQLRTALEPARLQLGLSTGGYAHPTLNENSSLIYAIDFQELRDQVRSAWNNSTGGVDIRWLVSDQLGTPRIIFDQSGNLSTVSRHDYLPFGEELFGGPLSQPGTGGRVTTQGYTTDSVRQKFTRQERDNETSLDWFQSRYDSSAQGRFTSPDSLGGRLVNPQTLNLYSYVRNNPLKYFDPSGHQEELHKKKGKRGDGETDPIIDPTTVKNPGNWVRITELGPVQDEPQPSNSNWNDFNRKMWAINFAIPRYIFGFEKFSFSPITSVVRGIGGEQGLHNYEDATMALIPLAIETRAEAQLEETEAAMEGEMDALLESTLAVRGGRNLPDNFTGGTGVTVDSNGLLNGLSVNSAEGVSVEQLSRGIPNAQIGVTTVGKIQEAGGTITRSPTARNPYHCTMCGITAEKASKLFTPTIRIPHKQ